MVLALGAAACMVGGLGAIAGPAAGAASSAPDAPVAAGPTAKLAWTARLIQPTVVRAGPGAGARRVAEVSAEAPYAGGPQSLLVLGAHASARGGVWYRVRLPSRPNTAAAWLPADVVRVERTPWRVRVRLSRRTAELFRSGKRVARWTVAVGTPANPTPTGLLAISEVVRQDDPSAFWGPYILTLTAHSNTLDEFQGADARTALHGTSQPNLLGQAVSHGCVRLPNDAADRLGRSVTPGTPVDIVR
jgi:lipoprotein-anchoring transpeptidase ErfK/SrfK